MGIPESVCERAGDIRGAGDFEGWAVLGSHMVNLGNSLVWLCTCWPYALVIPRVFRYSGRNVGMPMQIMATAISAPAQAKYGTKFRV